MVPQGSERTGSKLLGASSEKKGLWVSPLESGANSQIHFHVEYNVH